MLPNPKISPRHSAGGLLDHANPGGGQGAVREHLPASARQLLGLRRVKGLTSKDLPDGAARVIGPLKSPWAVFLFSGLLKSGQHRASYPERMGVTLTATASPVWPEAIACPSCGAILAAASFHPRNSVLICSVCRSALERSHARSNNAALALAAATLLLLIPSNLLPFLTTTVLAVSQTRRLGSAATTIWGDGWPWLALAIDLFVVVFPIIRFGLLTLVLGMLRLDRHPRWLGRAFRYANALQMWSMPDVFLLGLWIAYSRLAPTISVTLGSGAICFILAGLCSLFTRASLDRAAVWRAIAPEADAVPSSIGKISCESCELLLGANHDGDACPRCAATERN